LKPLNALGLVGLGLCMCLLLMVVCPAQAAQPDLDALAGDVTESVAADVDTLFPLCRYGFDDIGSMSGYPVEDLRAGWYVNFSQTPDASAPASLDHFPIVGLMPDGAGGYALRHTNVAAIVAQATANPGTTWIIGNEPDSPYQDNLEPYAYAEAYHDLYHAIKAADPTAKVANGGIVQVTPVRLLYLDMVLDAYYQRYAESMPVDVWNIHVYIIQERNCEVYRDCWGADIPPGIDWLEGELYGIDDNANLEVFQSMVLDFRAWMASRGYQDRPLIITEFGVQMPYDFGFPPSRVNSYMSGTFDFLETTTDTTGYPADGYRLVQRWAWWSLQRPAEWPRLGNGWLFDPDPPTRTVFGDNYASHTGQLSASANLFPVSVWTEPRSLYSPTQPVTFTLIARMANDGNISSGPSVVRFFAGTPSAPGEQIGSDLQVSDVAGCGGDAVVSVEMVDVSPGSHPIHVVVDAMDVVSETSETDNILAWTVLVSTHQVFLPLTMRCQ